MGLERHISTSVTFPPVMLEDLKLEAKARDLSLSQLIREYVRSGRMHGGQQGQLDLLRGEAAHDHSDH